MVLTRKRNTRFLIPNFGRTHYQDPELNSAMKSLSCSRVFWCLAFLIYLENINYMFFLLQMLRLVFVMIGFFPFPFSYSHYLASFIIPPTIKWEDNDKDKKTKIKKITMATLSPHSCHTFHCVQTIKREDRVASWSFFWFWILHIPCQSSRSFDQSASTRSTVGVFKTQFCALSWTKTKLPAKKMLTQDLTWMTIRIRTVDF